MQVKTVTTDFIFSTACNFEMLQELCIHKDFGGMTQAQVSTAAKQDLKKASKGTGNKTNGTGDLPNAKLRTILVKKLQESPTVGETFKEGKMQFEFNCLPDLDMGNAGANKTKRGASTQGVKGAKLEGAYEVVCKTKLKCTAESDPDKWAIWQHIWECNSFEEFFNKAPAKGARRSGKPISAASEIRWAVERGWIKPKATQQ